MQSCLTITHINQANNWLDYWQVDKILYNLEVEERRINHLFDLVSKFQHMKFLQLQTWIRFREHEAMVVHGKNRSTFIDVLGSSVRSIPWTIVFGMMALSRHRVLSKSCYELYEHSCGQIIPCLIQWEESRWWNTKSKNTKTVGRKRGWIIHLENELPESNYFGITSTRSTSALVNPYC